MYDRFGVIFSILSQNKKGEKGEWERTETWRVDSRIGQLLYYMVGVQMKSLHDGIPPRPLLGIYMEDGMV